MYNQTRLLLAVFALLFAACPVASRADTANAPSLSAEVESVMQKAKKGRFVYPRRLLQNEDVLPLLEKYADDPHPNVQDVLFLAADTYHTPAALQLHTALIERRHEQSIGNAFTYSPKEIREWGGPRLRSALLSYLRLDTNGMEGINSARALLMIGSFGPSVEVEAYLQDLRRSQAYLHAAAELSRNHQNRHNRKNAPHLFLARRGWT